jgi:hypothetical protein
MEILDHAFLQAGQELVVFVMRADPEPDDCVFANHTEGAPISIDADRVDGQLRVNFLNRSDGCAGFAAHNAYAASALDWIDSGAVSSRRRKFSVVADFNAG